MIEFIDALVIPGLWLVGAWTLRWSVLIGGLLLWFAIRSPHTAATRLLAARLVLCAGLLLPLIPSYWGPVLTPQQGENWLPQSTMSPAATSPRRDLPLWSRLPPAGSAADKSPVSTAPGFFENDPAPAVFDPASSPAALPLGWGRIVAVLIAVLWFVGLLVQIVRLAWGGWWLSRLCRDAVAIGSSDQAELEHCRQQLGLRRAVQLMQHPSVATPLMVGGWRPRVLVPADWAELPIVSRQSILLHELTHVQHCDDFARLMEELVRAIFWFHPLVHWLVVRIGAEREERCDAAVIGQGVSPRELAGVLIECCRRGAGRRVLPVRGLALPLFRQRTVKDRIQSLMEESTMSRWTDRTSWRAVAGLGLLVFGLSFAIAGFAVRAEEPEPFPPAPAKPVMETLPELPERTSFNLSELVPESHVDKEEFLRLFNEHAMSNQTPKLSFNEINVKGFGKFTLQNVYLSCLYLHRDYRRGQLVDLAGQPLVAKGDEELAARVTVLSYDRLTMDAWGGPDSISVLADAQGRFMTYPPPEDGFEEGRMLSVLVQLSGGASFEARYIPPRFSPLERKVVDVVVPTHLHPKVLPPQNVAADEIAGVVVDEQGQPLEGVEVALYEGYQPGMTTTSDSKGIFRIGKLAKYFPPGIPATLLVRFRKPGYSPLRFFNRPLGVAGWVIALDSRTFFEGQVVGPDGQPAAGAHIRANQWTHHEGTTRRLSEFWTETTADRTGRYRLYLQPDSYEIFVTSTGVGAAALPGQRIAYGEHRQQDFTLEPGITFQATVVDSQTGKPVSGVRLWQRGSDGIVEGRSNAEGRISISELFPGNLNFEVEGSGVARWWSDQSSSEMNKWTEQPEGGWHQNFDSLYFDIQQGMKPVTIVVEQGARIRGRVVDPEGQPVAGATVAPTFSETGRSPSGDTRFSVRTQPDGTFEIRLPASHQTKYNLLAHDGQNNEWRGWANGVLSPIRTVPGQEIDGVELKLTRPATVRGKVVDPQGKPLANHSVAAQPTDHLENYYWQPTTMTGADGTFELKFIRPGEHTIGPDYSWKGESTIVRLDAGQTVSDVVLVKPEEQVGPVVP